MFGVGGYDGQHAVLQSVATMLETGDLANSYEYLRWFLERLVSEGIMDVGSGSAGRENDNPDLRARAVALLPSVSGVDTNTLLAGLLKYEYDPFVEAAMMRAAGSIGSDPSGAVVREIARIISADIHGPGRPDEMLARAAVDGLEGIIRYHGEPTDEIGLQILLQIFRGDYPRALREAALDVIRGIRYY